MQTRGFTSFWMRAKKASLDVKMCKNHGSSLPVRHSLNNATFLGDSHIGAKGYIAMWTRPICIIANGPFSKNSV
jgi:hypothetical protein